ncbi:GDSL esterase/lipase [Dichanthelium oligosanthes]|uniref:GDSL esterase/lipase n=1 Tax=Dichanthelium oligosanthes TaxID=888268 RepID=A0A1E5WNE7_9POAL|nr:GDSL esterase/lipase [Dichanthelium oligosanthes]
MSVKVLVAVAGVRWPPAMYVIGDSTLDVGNNYYLPGSDVPRANRPYYGPMASTSPAGFPPGAKSMGFLSSPPPYLSLLALNSSLLLAPAALTIGVSYASADAGILDSTNAGKCIPLSKQVEYFNATRAQMVAAVGSDAVDDLLSKSVILCGVGSNDLFVFAAAEQSRNRSAAGQQSDAAALFADLISNYSATITELYALGARKFAIINVGLVGCVPAVRVLDASGACADGLNQLAAAFDDALRSLLASLAPRLPGLVYSLADSLGLTETTFADPQASGYTDIAGACCGSGRLLAEADCLRNSTICTSREERDQHVFWDRYHPAQRACFLTAQAFYNGPPQYTTPINFMQLAQSR